MNTPLPDCPKCKGAGKFINGLKQERDCICVSLSSDDNTRRIVVESFQETIKKMREELKSGNSPAVKGAMALIQAIKQFKK